MNLIVTSRLMAMAALIASTLLAGCGLRCRSPSTETFTVYEDAPKISQLDLGPPGNSPGDVYHFFAPLYSSAGGPVTGEVSGTKTVVKLATDARPNLERRATLLFFTFGEQQDQIIALGVHEYPTNVPEFEAGKSVARAILGGTGKYMGARGEVTSTRNADGSYNAGIYPAQVIGIIVSDWRDSLWGPCRKRAGLSRIGEVPSGADPL